MGMKSIFESRTFWLAVGQAVAGALVIFATAYPELGILMLLKSVIDVILRANTETKISV